MFAHLLPSLRKQPPPAVRPVSFTDLIEEFWREPFGLAPGWPPAKDFAFPALDVSETPTEIVVKAELPGLEAGDLDITVHDDVLTIRGEKKFAEEDKGEHFHRIERGYGRFERVVALPAEVSEEGVRAKLASGVLTVTLAKGVKEEAKKITIES